MMNGIQHRTWWQWAVSALCLFAGLTGSAESNSLQLMSFEDCVGTALENNRQCRISEVDVRIAETLLTQAKSAYWPSLSAGMMAGRMDDAFTFSYPASRGLLTIPAGVMGPDAVSITVDTPAQEMEILGRGNISGSLDLIYPLYTGGLRGALTRQARFGIEAARQGVRRSEQQVVFDVKRAYYGTVMARRLVTLADDTLQRMEVTLEMTQSLYENGSGTVKKTDWLQNKMTVEVIRSMKVQAETGLVEAQAALAYVMGVDRGTAVEPLEEALPLPFPPESLGNWISRTLLQNPDLKQVRAGIGALEARKDEAKSRSLPTVALNARYQHAESTLDGGLMNADNRDISSVSVVVQLPLFEGFRHHSQVRESSLRLEKMRLQAEMLEDGLSLQVERAHAALIGAIARRDAMEAGLQAAVENRELHMRAFREELVDAKDLMETQFTEALLSAMYQKTLYECVEGEAQLDMLAGQRSCLTRMSPPSVLDPQ